VTREELPEHVDDVDAIVTGKAVGTAGPLGFARMTGSSIAGRDAAAWVTDFLNAAYYRRAIDERGVDDLRLAFSVLTTYWYRKASGRRLHLSDLPAFHRAFGSDRFDAHGVLSRGQLLEGADRLLGEGFGDAYADDARAPGGSASRRSRSAWPTRPTGA